MTKRKMTHERIRTFNSQEFKKPLSVKMRDTWQATINEFIFQCQAFFPKKQISRCEMEGHVVFRTDLTAIQCQECGATVRPGAKIRSVIDLPNKAQQSQCLRIWRDD